MDFGGKVVEIMNTAVSYETNGEAVSPRLVTLPQDGFTYVATCT